MRGLCLPRSTIVVEAFDSDDGTSRWTPRALAPFKTALQQVLQDCLDELKQPLGVPIRDSCIDAILVLGETTARRQAKKRKRTASDLRADASGADEPSHPGYHDPFGPEATTSMGYPVMGDSERCKTCGQWQDYVCEDVFMCMACGE